MIVDLTESKTILTMMEKGDHGTTSIVLVFLYDSIGSLDEYLDEVTHQHIDRVFLELPSNKDAIRIPSYTNIWANELRPTLCSMLLRVVVFLLRRGVLLPCPDPEMLSFDPDLEAIRLN